MQKVCAKILNYLLISHQFSVAKTLYTLFICQNQEPDGVEAEVEVDTEGGTKLHDLRLSILEKLIQFAPWLSEVGGVRAIPFMQVVEDLLDKIYFHLSSCRLL